MIAAELALEVGEGSSQQRLGLVRASAAIVQLGQVAELLDLHGPDPDFYKTPGRIR